MNDLNELLRDDIVLTCVSVEADYCKAWRETVLPNWPCKPVALAISGGRMASQFAQVFIAGYQAAIRATFPQIPFAGLATLAVSEDRNAIDPLPGVIVIHERWGLDDGVRALADRIAGQGYVVLAVDLYGQVVALLA